MCLPEFLVQYIGDIMRLIPIIILVVTIAIKIFMKINKTRTNKNKLNLIAEDRMREEALNQALYNQYYKGEDLKTQTGKTPFNITYNRQATLKVDKQYMLKITVYTSMSTKEYMIPANRTIQIGKGHNNEISINDNSIKETQCEIFLHHGNSYIKDIYDNNVMVLKRCNNSVFINNQGIQLKSNDLIMLGNTKLKIEIVKS